MGAHSLRLLTLTALVVTLAGCGTYKGQNKILGYWTSGNIAQAEKEATARATKEANGKDGIVWKLEQATVLRAAGKMEESTRAFAFAEARMDQYAEEAKVKVGNEAGALLSNQANLPYRGRSYDGIMLNTYKALNYLALGQPDKARPEIIRAYQRQQDAVAENQRRLERTQEQLAQTKDKDKVEAAQSDARFQSQLAGSYAHLDELKSYADYVNPFTVLLDGIYFLHQRTGGSDLERARKSLERILAFGGPNKYIEADLQAVEAAVLGQEIPPTTYVLFETGCAPMRDQIRIDIPILITDVSYVGAAFPKLVFNDSFVPSLSITANGAAEHTVLVASMDSVIGLAFKNELPTIITKTVAATVVKAVAAYAANRAASQADNVAGIFVRLATAAYQAAVNVADTRTWTTLPKQFQYCRLPTPPDRQLEIGVAGSPQKTKVTVGEGSINVVYVRSITATTPMLVTQMRLK